ncbi:MAG TPA: zinc-ribbon and DUF3426 domain-containing protein [Thiobacillaceae bacterium]|nr:zinc-ribbon and DUF3426 domain-containing protein [Thiobacillaceae bacterium]
MSLHATCPRCHTIFRISEQQLAAADGWAQCGVCAAPFDVLADLPEEERTLYLTPPQPEPPAEPHIAEPVARVAKPEQEAAPLPPSAEPAAEISEAAPLPLEPELQASSAEPHLPGLERRIGEVTTEAQGAHPSDLPSIIILDPDAKIPDEYGPLPVIPAAPANHTTYGDEPLELDEEEDEEGADEIARAPAAPIVSRSIPGESAPAAVPAPARHRTGWLWIIVPLLIVLLAGQLVYFLRDPLAANYPGLRPLLASVCNVLNCQVGLPQNVEKIKILGSDLQAEPGNGKRLTLALTLANQASYAQAWPMLQLTLTDTRDKPLARRVFAPSEYLNSPDMLAAGIPAMSETPLNLHLETRDVNASGFRVEVFY